MFVSNFDNYSVHLRQLLDFKIRFRQNRSLSESSSEDSCGDNRSGEEDFEEAQELLRREKWQENKEAGGVA